MTKITLKKIFDKIKAWYKQWLLDNEHGVTNEIDEFYKDREMPKKTGIVMKNKRLYIFLFHL